MLISEEPAPIIKSLHKLTRQELAQLVELLNALLGLSLGSEHDQRARQLLNEIIKKGNEISKGEVKPLT
jgi:hypothetical protein